MADKLKTGALEALIALVEKDTGVNGNCKDDPDEDSVGWSDSGPLPMTFGHVRKARAELEEIKNAPPCQCA